MFFIRSLKSSWLIALLLFVNANPSLAWDAFAVGESVALMQSGTDYNVEISCAKTNGSKLRLEIRRVYPPIDEIERISSVTLHIYTGTSLGLCCTNPVRDSSRESSVVAGVHEQTYPPDRQDPELARL